MISDVKGIVRQPTHSVAGDGDANYLATTKLGQLLTASWRENLVMAGKAWAVTVGAMSQGAYTRVTGGGSGTTTDFDQPELFFDVPIGYYLIPLRIMVSGRPDIDAADDNADIIVIVDREAAITIGTTQVTETPLNLLDGAAGFPGKAYSAATADVTDPTCSEILDEVTWISNATNVDTSRIKMDYVPPVPIILAGPCAIYVYWGGTVALPAIARAEFAAVPASWFPVS